MTDPATRPAARRPLPFWDMPVTVALLLGGLYSATVRFGQAPDAGYTLDTLLTSVGANHYTHTALAIGAAYASAGSELLALLIAIGFSVPRLRARRRAFWIPLVSAGIGFVLSNLFTVIALFGDPSFIAYVQSSMGR